jgi:hypothetical protein
MAENHDDRLTTGESLNKVNSRRPALLDFEIRYYPDGKREYIRFSVSNAAVAVVLLPVTMALQLPSRMINQLISFWK